MIPNLDKWIKDARDDAPDSGEYRRLNRAMLKERMGARGTGRRRYHRVLLGVLSLVFLMLFSGQFNQLGSDGFDTVETTVFRPWSGDSITIYSNVFRPGSTNLPSDFTAEDNYEWQQSVATGEETIYMASGVSYGGKTIWIKNVARYINGKENKGGQSPTTPPSQTPDNYMDFVKTNLKNLTARTKIDPPHEKMKMIVDGVLIDFGVWTYEYPDFGEVSYYLGFPVEQ